MLNKIANLGFRFLIYDLLFQAVLSSIILFFLVPGDIWWKLTCASLFVRLVGDYILWWLLIAGFLLVRSRIKDLSIRRFLYYFFTSISLAWSILIVSYIFFQTGSREYFYSILSEMWMITSLVFVPPALSIYLLGRCRLMQEMDHELKS